MLNVCECVRRELEVNFLVVKALLKPRVCRRRRRRCSPLSTFLSVRRAFILARLST